MALVGAAAVPLAVEATVGPLDPASFDPDSDLMRRAQEIAEREFSGDAELTVLGVTVTEQRTGVFGERIEPDAGYRFHVAKVRLQNTGKIDIAVSSWHFSGLDEIGSDHAIEPGGAHDDFDGSRLGKGQARVGSLTFELPQGSYLAGMVWQGELASTHASVGPYSR